MPPPDSSIQIAPPASADTSNIPPPAVPPPTSIPVIIPSGTPKTSSDGPSQNTPETKPVVPQTAPRSTPIVPPLQTNVVNQTAQPSVIIMPPALIKSPDLSPKPEAATSGVPESPKSSSTPPPTSVKIVTPRTSGNGVFF